MRGTAKAGPKCSSVNVVSGNWMGESFSSPFRQTRFTHHSLARRIRHGQTRRAEMERLLHDLTGKQILPRRVLGRQVRPVLLLLEAISRHTIPRHPLNTRTRMAFGIRSGRNHHARGNPSIRVMYRALDSICHFASRRCRVTHRHIKGSRLATRSASYHQALAFSRDLPWSTQTTVHATPNFSTHG